MKSTPLMNGHPDSSDLPPAFYIGQKLAPFLPLHYQLAIAYDELVQQGVLENTQENYGGFVNGRDDAVKTSSFDLGEGLEAAFRSMIKYLCDAEKAVTPPALEDGADALSLPKGN